MKTVGESAELRKEMFETCFKEEIEQVKKKASDEASNVFCLNKEKINMRLKFLKLN